MIRVLMVAASLSPVLPAMVQAQDIAGEFDYYVMALSWSPNWCALEGDGRNSPQCDPGTGFGWVLHGLWPQYEEGWPERCRTRFSEPTRGQTEGMEDIMGTSGLAWHQWNKHGVCVGVSPGDYYGLSREAFGRVEKPPVFMGLERTVALPARVVEEAFLRDNPDIGADGLTVTCRGGMIQEVRICLTRELEFRDCGADVVRDCTLEDALFEPVR
jgi:ribonuclease T2